MIGPHEGKELALMLEGKKPAAMFHDALALDGSIAEDIIPEKAFAPYVEQGQMMRFSDDILNTRDQGQIIRYVCFTLPGEEWRAHFILWLKQEVYSNRLDHSAAHDEIIGRLLGYGRADIADFLDGSEKQTMKTSIMS